MGGYPFYKSALKGLMHCSLGMDLLIVLATTIAYVYSVVVLILDTVEDLDYDLFFDSGPLLLLFISFGRLLEHIAKVSKKVLPELLGGLSSQHNVIGISLTHLLILSRARQEMRFQSCCPCKQQKQCWFKLTHMEE